MIFINEVNKKPIKSFSPLLFIKELQKNFYKVNLF